ncbi:MAG: DUF433 domain-containing protein [Acidobacteriaceae bacterium]|nr:DUF433 domain-containing protein [Acidobacteriaceae bacterium]MBV9764102.1 DUF433 domain-containing protein [Acidobacteriaceae bacterium]
MTAIAAHPRITIEAGKRGGKPCIRGHRITVEEVLRWLASGASEDEILADYPQLEKEDFQAIYAYAADRLHLDSAASQ